MSTIARCMTRSIRASPASRPTCGSSTASCLSPTTETRSSPGGRSSPSTSPLRGRVGANGGSVYRHWDGSLQLLVDIKSDGPQTYRAVSDTLVDYRKMLTRFAPSYDAGAVEVVISGNRPLADMVAQRTRYAGYDGRLADLAGGLPATVMPLVSDNWGNNFTWQGAGPMPVAEQTKLLSIVQRAHDNGYRVRFWNTPTSRVWRAPRSGRSFQTAASTTSTQTTWSACRDSC